jgi:hypothetical protein
VAERRVPSQVVPLYNRWFLEGNEQRYVSSFSLISLPLNGPKLKFQVSALTLLGMFMTIPSSFGPPATQLALVAICLGTMALALIERLRRTQPEPVKCRSEGAKDSQETAWKA